MPDITQGTTATIASTGTNHPDTGHTWEIRKGGAVIAHSSDTQGWTVANSGTTSITVTCPIGAVVATDYEARVSFPTPVTGG